MTNVDTQRQLVGI